MSGLWRIKWRMLFAAFWKGGSFLREFIGGQRLDFDYPCRCHVQVSATLSSLNFNPCFLVSVTSGLDTMEQDTKFEAQQSGVTVALSNAVVSAVQGAVSTGETQSNAPSNTSSSRMQGLAGAAGALAGYNTYNKVKDILKDPSDVGGISINISLGSSQSSGSTHDASTTAVGSQVVSAGSVNVTARNPKTQSRRHNRSSHSQRGQHPDRRQPSHRQRRHQLERRPGHQARGRRQHQRAQ